MNRILVLSFATFSTLMSWGQRKNPTRIPLTVEISKEYSMAATEVTVAEWMEFVAANNYIEQLFPEQNIIEPLGYGYLFDDLKKRQNFQYLRAYPSKGFKKNFISPVEIRITNEILDKMKVNGFNPLLLPVTGVSYEQAVQFCKWKQEYINSQGSKLPKLLITLPSEEDYRTIITDKDSVSAKGMLSYNFKTKGVTVQPFLVRADMFRPNELGLYCIQGNASEMTDTKGVAMGGSFAHYAIQSYKDQRQKYSNAQSWLGFRYSVRLKK